MIKGFDLNELREKTGFLEHFLLEYTGFNEEKLENIKRKYELEYLNEYYNELFKECKKYIK